MQLTICDLGIILTELFLNAVRVSHADISMVQNKQFLPKETLVYIRLLEYSLQALDIYTINVTPYNQTHTKSPA